VERVEWAFGQNLAFTQQPNYFLLVRRHSDAVVA
jgi:hypothetical protein